jgi:hypothetical protein
MPAKPPEKRRTTIAFDKETYKRLRIYCIEKEVALSDAVNAAVQYFLSSKR